MSAPWDAGLQNERTRLAWQRTALSGLACSLIVARLLAPASVTAAVMLGLAATMSAAGLGRLTSRRYRFTQSALHRGRPVGDARPHLLLMGLVVLTGLGAVLYATFRT